MGKGLCSLKMGCEVMGGALEPLFGDVGGGGAVMVGMETLQDGEGGLCSLKMGCEIVGGGLWSPYLGMWGVVGL